MDEGPERRNRDDCTRREAIPGRPCMYFGSDVVVSCLRADAACLKMDARACVRLRVCAEAAHPQMDVKTGASLRTERHLEGTFQGRTHS